MTKKRSQDRLSSKNAGTSPYHRHRTAAKTSGSTVDRGIGWGGPDAAAESIPEKGEQLDLHAPQMAPVTQMLTPLLVRRWLSANGVKICLEEKQLTCSLPQGRAP